MPGAGRIKDTRQVGVTAARDRLEPTKHVYSGRNDGGCTDLLLAHEFLQQRTLLPPCPQRKDLLFQLANDESGPPPQVDLGQRRIGVDVVPAAILIW